MSGVVSTVGADEGPVLDLRDRFGARPAAPAVRRATTPAGAAPRTGAVLPGPRVGVLRRAALLEGLAGLADVPGDLGAALDRLAPAARRAFDADLIDAVLRDPAAARACRTTTPNRQVATAIRRWRRSGPRPVAVGAHVAVPMVVDGEVVGALRIRPSGPAPLDESLLLAVAAGLGAVAARVAADARAAAATRALAVAAERDRIARDLYDTVHRRLRALRATLASGAGDAAGQVARADADVLLAAAASAFLGSAERGLVPAVRTLVRTLASPDVAVRLHIRGAVRPLPPGTETALVRVAHDLVRNAVRHARASTVTVTVGFADDRVSVAVRDDGTGTAERATEQPGLHSGIRTLQRRLADAGGGVDVTNLRPHGICLYAWVVTSG